MQYDERWVVDATLSYAQDGWQVGAYVRNLLDAEYLVVERGGELNNVSIGEPRVFGVFLQRNF